MSTHDRISSCGSPVEHIVRAIYPLPRHTLKSIFLHLMALHRVASSWGTPTMWPHSLSSSRYHTARYWYRKALWTRYSPAKCSAQLIYFLMDLSYCKKKPNKMNAQGTLYQKTVCNVPRLLLYRCTLQLLTVAHLFYQPSFTLPSNGERPRWGHHGLGECF